MPGTPICAWCLSTDTQAGFTMVQCLICGRFTTFDGERTVATSDANEGVAVTDLPEVEVAEPPAPVEEPPAPEVPAEPTPEPTPEPTSEPDPAPEPVPPAA